MIGSTTENDGSSIKGKIGTVHTGYICSKRRLLGRFLSFNEKLLAVKHLP
jgi:hypothetical protein